MSQFSELAELIVNGWLPEMVSRSATDLILSTGSSPMLRIDGRIQPLSDENTGPLPGFPLRQALEQLVAPEYWEALEHEGSTHLTFSRRGLARFRLTMCHQLAGLTVTFRALPLDTPNVENLGFDETFLDRFWLLDRGLVLIGGQPGHGITTTLAALVDVFNRLRNDRIMCFENPVEILQRNKNSVVSQRDIRKQGGDLPAAVKLCKHEQPDIIVIGDTTDEESFQTIFQLVEEGYLVIAATRHKTAAEMLERIFARLPLSQHSRYLEVLAENLQIIMTQMLLPSSRLDGRVIAREVLFREPELESILREQEWSKLSDYARQNTHLGMAELDNVLLKLVQSVEISARTAFHASHKPADFIKLLRRNGIAMSELDTLEKACLEHSTTATSSNSRRSLGQRYERAASSSSTRNNRRRGWSNFA